YLTLHGVIPTSAQARAFFADSAPDKRAQLIDTLLADPQFARFLAVQLDVMLMERRGELHVKALPWREYLEASIAAGKPWTLFVREILTNDGADETTRGAARWVLEREADPSALTRDTARLLLGRDLGCAQCHDHPKIDDFAQRDYAGIQAFFNRTYLFRPDVNKPGVVGEQAAGEVSFMSVFTKVGDDTKPRLPGEKEIEEPSIAPAEEWAVAPNDKDKNVRPIPKFSRRAQLATALSDGHNAAFRRNIANRLWGIVFGRGLIEPMDLDHSANPAAEPEVLGLLANAVAEMNFDMKAFIRELALTQAFQRSLDLPPILPEFVQTARETLPQLEQQTTTLASAANAAESAFDDTRRVMLKVLGAAAPAKAEWQKKQTAVAEAAKLADGAGAELKKSEEALAAKRDGQRALGEAAAKIQEAIARAPEAADLADAAKIFDAKAGTTAHEIPTVEKDADAKKADLEAKSKALAASQQAAAEAQTILDEQRQQIATQQAALDAAAAQKREERIKAKHTAQLASEVEAVLAWHQAVAADAPLRAAADQAAAALSEARQRAESLTAQTTGAPAKLAELEGALAAANEAARKANEGMTAKRPAADALAEAAAKAAEAAAKFPADAEIKGAADAVKSKAESAAAEVASIEKSITDARASCDVAAKTLNDAQALTERANAELSAVQQQLPTLEAAAAAAAAKVAETAPAVDAARDALSNAWSPSFAAAGLTPLTPEQMCWSVMRATGVLDAERAQAITEWDAKNPVRDADKAYPSKKAERLPGIERLFREKIRGHEDQYVRSFGGAPASPQTDFFATPEQALYFENAGVLRSWVGGLAGRISALPDAKAMAEELYLSTLTRWPADSEVAELAGTISARPPEKKPEAIADLAWALLTSTEFRFAH
ncbi:MAG: DUF1549 domain-containing protein, partial [Chthoniobacteraceae bacterium]